MHKGNRGVLQNPSSYQKGRAIYAGKYRLQQGLQDHAPRQTKKTPDVMKMTVEMKEGTATQKIPVMKLGNYSLEDIFNKNLLILIPFHIFLYENKLMVYNSNKEELEKLKEVFYKVKKHLDMLVESGELDAYDRFFLISMTIKVVENLAEKFEHVVKGVIEVMSGTKIEYMGREEFYRIREEGLAAGRSEGFNAGRSEGFNAGRSEGFNAGRSEGFSAGRSEGLAVGERKAYLAMFRKGILTLAEVAKELNISEEAVKQYL